MVINFSRTSHKLFGKCICGYFRQNNAKAHVTPALQAAVRQNRNWKRKSDDYGGERKTFSEDEVIILCKNAELNHYKSQMYGKFDIVPLASKGWKNRLSKGDYFIINFSQENPALQTQEQQSTFYDLGIDRHMIDLLNRNGIDLPTMIQVVGIPYISEGRNTLLTAETGSGKTLAYLLPIIQNILSVKKVIPPEAEMFNSPLALVITPGRELAAQIGGVAQLFSKNLPFTVKTVVGGRTKRRMMNPRYENIDLLIASFGALSKLTTTKVYSLSQVQQLVLDEADTLLDNSFNDQVTYFLKKFRFKHDAHILDPSKLKSGVQLILTSATLPTSIADILGEIIQVESLAPAKTSHIHRLLPHVPQKFIRLGLSQKPEELLKIVKLDVERKRPVIIFSNKTATCDWVSMFLNENGIRCINLNKKMYYDQRMGQFKMFQNAEVDVLSCTDVASRGLDTLRVKHVINYEFPMYMADYIHRSGRTGRVGSEKDCRVTNFVCGPAEVELTQKIEHAVRKNLESLPNVNANITAIIEQLDKKKRGLNNSLLDSLIT